MKKYLSFVFFIFLFVSLAAQQKQNPYQLHLINNPEAYKEDIAKNPDHELVNLKDYLSYAIFDIRYATPNNFTTEKIYSAPEAYARKAVAVALQSVEKALDSLGLRLIIYDAYRPYAATLRFYEVYPDTNFVAAPWQGSRHNRGAAVDVGLADKRSGKAVSMPSRYDEFTEKAAANFLDLPDEILHNRNLLIQTMTNHGFTVYPSEWWHFDYQGWQKYSLMDLSFDELERIKE